MKCSSASRIRNSLLLAALLYCFGSSAVFGQTTGSIQGTVTDQQGGLMPGANLELINNETGARFTQTSGPNASYFFNSMKPGVYSLKASKEGFRAGVTSGLIVGVNSVTTVDIHLSLGSLSETITVSAGVEQVDVATAQVGTSVSAKFVKELPNMNRGALTYALMAPGVDITTQAEGGSQVMNILSMWATVNGNREQRNNFYLDGQDNSGSYRNSAMQFPNPDAVQEMQITTSNTSAEMGRQVGGVFNVVTKSGTNEFHGTGFYFTRATALNANTWDRNRLGQPRPNQPMKMIGGTLGGPVRKDRTFFFGSFMRYTNRSSGSSTTRSGVTSQMVNGDFSGIAGLQLKDPDSGVPIANNQIPLSLASKVGKQFMTMVPNVSSWGQKYQWFFDQPATNQEVMSKVDHRWNDKHMTVGTFLHTWGNGVYPASAANVSGTMLNSLPTFSGETDGSNQWTFSTRHTYLISPVMISESEFGLTRHVADRGMSAFGGTAADLGASNFPGAQDGARKYPAGFQINATDGVRANQGWLSLFNQHNYHFGEKLTFIKSSHSVKLGLDFKRDTVRQLNDQDSVNFAFDGRYAGVQSNLASAYADLYMGRTTGFTQSGILDYDIYNWASFFFVEDTWKVNSKLTLTPGLRYEFYLPAREKDGRASAYVAGNQSSQFPGAPKGMAFPGDPGVPTGFIKTELNNIAPRFGVAYNVTGNGKWSIRGGVGKYFSYNSSLIKMLSSETPPWRPSANCPGATQLDNPWVGCTVVNYSASALPTPFARVKAGTPYKWPALVSTSMGYSPDFRTPYSVQWNVSIEHELARNITLSGSYVANRGRDLTQSVPLNYGIWSSTATSANILARKPIAGYDNIVMYSPIGKTSYRALQSVLNVRMSSFSSAVTYNWARGYDNVGGDIADTTAQVIRPACPGCEWAENARHHTLRAFYAWDIPLLSSHKAWTGRLLGGWQLSGSLNIQSGSRMNVTTGQDWNYDGLGGDRPDSIGAVRYTNNKDLGNGYFQWYDVGATTAASGQRGPFATPTDHSVFGNLGRNALVGPGQWSTDAALLKNFHVTERQYFQFRLEGANILNHPIISNPDNSFYSSNMGRAFGKYSNRNTQIGLKYYF